MMNNKHYDRLNLSDFDKLMQQYMLEDKVGRSEKSLRIGLNHALEQEPEMIHSDREEELIDKLRAATQGKGLGAAGEIIF
jgi:hypothetical protein